MVGLSEYVPIDFISVSVLGALLLRRLVRMDGHHWTRVVILTCLLWVPVFFLFMLSLDPLFPPHQQSCVPTDEGRQVFCISEY